MDDLQFPSSPRVVLLTSPGLFGAIIINTLAGQPGIELVGVGLTNRLFKGKGVLASARAFVQRTGWRYTFYGFIVSNLAWVVLRLTGRPHGLCPLGKNVRLLHDVNSPETLDWLKGLQPDYVASFYFNQWIGPEVRATAQIACVNMHPSLLPALRGPDPVFRALERGLTCTGITIHSVEDAFDAGHILFQEEQPLPPQSTHFGAFLTLVRDGARALAEWLAGRRPAPSAPVAAEGGPVGDYTTFPTPAEVRAFVKSGRRLVRSREFWRAVRDVT